MPFGNKNAGSTVTGDPYKACFLDDLDNLVSRLVNHPELISKYFHSFMEPCFCTPTIASRYQAVTASSFLPPSSLQVVLLRLAQYLMSNATTRLVAVISCCLVVLLLTCPKHLEARKVSSLTSTPSASPFIVIYFTAVPSSTAAVPALNHKIFIPMGGKTPDTFG